ncbi:glycosyltransferase family 2 protein [Sphingobacterium pedocola]|uniref:Glycosyltransferase 2-like domain-containing protein n=1 Tax=Sphingobacterium pedocola TaxID=2082722 RepID=A0ABR9TAE8_9SPHI|nr:glycosyltransferase family A protein [Sphingobacterium pedocola]MBE8722313.1 hypothetical protein [Sphingobacterium pedocola]
MAPTKDLISIVIPAYNVSRTISETIDSVLKQTFRNFEIIVVNDGSRDETEGVVINYANRFREVKLYNQENKGLPATRNEGFGFSKGNFVIFLDGDDKLDPRYIETCYQKFKKYPDLDLVYTDTLLFEAKEGIFDLPDYSYKQLLAGNCIPATAMIKADNFREVGMYDVSLKMTEDWELWIRYLAKFPNVYQVKLPLFHYRKRLSSDSMTDLNSMNNYDISDLARLYIYQKHYNLFTQYGYGLEKLQQLIGEENKYKEKYYNVWYRKLFYQLRNRKKLQ